MTKKPTSKVVANAIVGLLAICVVAVFIWQGITAGGVPDPTAEHLNKFAVVMNKFWHITK